MALNNKLSPIAGRDQNGNYSPIAVNEKGEVITQLTGSKVEKDTLNGRKIRTSNSGLVRIDRPSGVKGFVVYLMIHGVTGTFSDNEGVSIRLRTYAQSTDGGSTVISSQATKKTSISDRTHLIYFYPSTDLSNLGNPGGSEMIAISVPAPSVISPQIEIEGQFEEGEGIDCEVVIEWLI